MESDHGPREEPQSACVCLKAPQHVGGVEETDHGHSGEEGGSKAVQSPARAGRVPTIIVSDHLPKHHFTGLKNHQSPFSLKA